MILLACSAPVALAQQPAQQPAQAANQLMTNVKVGDMAPDFTLPDQNNKPVKLSDFRGKKQVVLAFYVLAFTSG
jgi:cytochrome oxidase Cu insertion factor (SCO1/SenC/PrrC family)